MRLAAAALLYAAITALLLRNLLPVLTTHLYSDLGDPLLVTTILAWNATHLPLTEAWWNFPSFAPASGVTAFTEHLLLAYPISSPIIWLTGNPVLAYNVVYLVAKPLNALAAYALGRHLTGSRIAGWVGGLAFAFAPYQAMHMGHLQLMLSFGMPFTLLWLHRYLQGGGRKAAALVGVGWLLVALSNAYLLVFFPILAALWALWFVRPREWRRLVPPLLAAGAATLVVAPLLWGYRVRLAEYGFARGMAEIREFSADVVSLLAMFHASFAWRQLLPHHGDETALFPGFTIVALALMAIWQTRQPADAPPSRWSRRLLAASGILTAIVLWRVWAGPWGWELGPFQLPPFDPHRVFSLAVLLAIAGVLATRWWRRAWARRDPIVFYGAAVFVLFLLALGPLPEWSTPWRVITYGPYWLLMHIPPLNAVRLPSRIWLVAVLCLGVLAAYGTAALLRRRGHRPALIAAALTILIVVEGSFIGGTVEVPAPMPSGLIPRGALVLDLPIEVGSTNGVAQYRAVLGGYRTINGYSGYEPTWFAAFLNELKRMGPRTFDAYRRTEDLYVVARTGVDPVLLEWVASLPGAEPRPGAPHIYIHRLPRLAPNARR